MEERRRRVPRQEVGWPGYCGLDDDPESAWYGCQVLSISILGAGVEIYDLGRPVVGARIQIFDPDADDLVGHNITVDARATGGGSISIRFTGMVRNVRPGPQGSVHVGIEFLGLSETERTMLEALERMQVVW